MDPTFIATLIICLLSLVHSNPVGFIGWPHDASTGQEGPGNLWHVFRQVHASEVASRQLLSSSRTPSSKVAETMRIITKEERGRSYEPSFTIISRIKSPVEQMLALLPPRPSWTPNFLGRRTETIPIRKEETSSSRTSTTSFNSYSPSHNASNLIIIGEAEPVIEDQRHVETSRKYDGLFTVEKGMVRYRMSSQPDNLGGNGHYHGSESPATFGLWEMMKMRRPQKWDALNKLLPSSQSTTEREEPAATTQPSTTTTTSTTPLSWNAHESGNHESFHRLENDDSVLVTDINSRTTTIFPTTSATGSQQEIPDATTTAANGSQSEEEEESSIHRSTTSTQPITAAPHSSWLVVRVDDSTCYAATDSFATNGTVVFKRFQLAELCNQSGWTDLSNIEKYFPGFGRIAGTKPNRLIVRTIIVADEDEEQLTDQEEEEQYYFITPQSVHTDTTIEHQTVSIVSSNSSLFTDEIMSSHNESNDEANAVPHHLESLNSFGFRKVDDDKPAVNSVEPGNNNAETAADHLLAMNLTVVADDVSNVTAMPFISNEEQMTPPLLKTLENLLLTHLLPSMTSSSSMSSSPISSSSSAPSNFTLPPPTSSSTTTSSYHFMFDHSPLTSTTSTTPAATSFTSSTTSPTTTSTADSYFSWLLHHEPVQSINDWPIVSQLIEPAHMTSTYPPSTTVLPTKKMMQSPAHYDPAINKATLSSHSTIISSRNPSLSQPIIPSYPLRQPSSAITEKPLTPSPIQMFTLKPENEAPKFITNKPISSKKNTGLASLILAHTSALMSGQNSPFLNDMRRSTNSSSDVRQTKTNSNFLPEPVPITATVHVIVASPYPDPEHEEELNRRRSLDSRVRNNNKNSIITGNSSWAFPSFTQLIESPDLLSTKTSSPVIRPVNATPVSSFNGNIDDDLPSLPRFSCGNHSSSDELVITNPNYPNPDDDAGNCNFRLLVNSHHVCQIRVEFRDSRMLLPRKGNCLHQYLTVSESTSAGRLRSPVVENKFCGFNSDQHFYVELTQPEMPNNTRHVDFKINTKAAGFPYRYSMIVSQINCDLPSPNKAPTGCFQYFNSRAGVIKSFNFEGGQYWNNQNYRICVQTIDNSCTLALSSTEGDFGIHKARSRRLPANRSGVGMKACPRDYLWIPGTIQSEEKNLSNETHDRYCGSKLSDRRGDFRHRIVTARMYNSVHVIIFHTGTPRHYNASQHGPGFRIDFEQMSECPSQSILNNYSYTFNSTGTDAALVNEEDDYYDEADDDKEVVHLSSNNKRSFE